MRDRDERGQKERVPQEGAAGEPDPWLDEDADPFAFPHRLSAENGEDLRAGDEGAGEEGPAGWHEAWREGLGPGDPGHLQLLARTMVGRRRRRYERRVGRRATLARPIMATVVLAIAAAAAVPVTWALSLWAATPDLDELPQHRLGVPSKIYSADGKLLGFVRANYAREPVAAKQIPAIVRKATVAIEDRRFYEHDGVDPIGVLRAAITNAEAGTIMQGGSTITQQLIRNAYTLDDTDSLQRKVDEAKLAYQLEDRHSKAEILTRYLNSIPYGTKDGRTAVGIEAAARMFFSKPARRLTLPEAALLAGLPQAPTHYNPLARPKAARKRRGQVLEAMRRAEMITPAEMRSAKRAPLGLRPSDRYTTRREPALFALAEQELIERYGAATVRRGGLEAKITINPKMQKQAAEAIAATLGRKGDPDSAIATIDPHSGAILALVSSTPYERSQFDLAVQARRQPGSAFKTFVLAAAVRAGVDPATTYYTSRPLNLYLPEYGSWDVSTYDGSYIGSVSAAQAMLSSDNSVYAQLALDVGPKRVAETARELGVRSQLDGLPAEALGGLEVGVSPLEMASAYATLAAGGVYRKPTILRRVKHPGGRIDKPARQKGKRVMSDGEAAVVTDVLTQNVIAGTGTAARLGGCPVAGKTGTTDDYKDAWFVGYTPLLATATWVGYADEPRPMTSVHGIAVAGGTFPAQIFGRYMRRAIGRSCEDFPAPEKPAQLAPLQAGFAAGDSTGYPVIAPHDEADVH